MFLSTTVTLKFVHDIILEWTNGFNNCLSAIYTCTCSYCMYDSGGQIYIRSAVTGPDSGWLFCASTLKYRHATDKYDTPPNHFKRTLGQPAGPALGLNHNMCILHCIFSWIIFAWNYFVNDFCTELKIPINYRSMHQLILSMHDKHTLQVYINISLSITCGPY